MNSRNFFLYIRAIQGHTGGNLIALELLFHTNGKNSCFTEDALFDVTSILK